ncbi:MAG: alkaline phosphatase [Bacteroidales bacterium]|nr:alkaline phosphatase [Bacteroidales bacterium]
MQRTRSFINFSKYFWLVLFSLETTIAGCQSKTLEEQEVRNVVLMIGDGMGISQVYAAYTAAKGNLNMFSFPVTGLLLTYSEDNYITDSAAGATAFACGKKTINGALGVDSKGKVLKNIFEIAYEKQWATGIVVTCEVTHATPAAFYAHVESRQANEAIARDLAKANINLVIGGGKKYFADTLQPNAPAKLLRQKGYRFNNSLEELSIQYPRQICLLSDSHLPPVKTGRGDYLPMATEKALKILEQNKNGFLLMIEGSQIDWGGHQNDIDYVISETLDFDRAVGKVLEFARKDKHTLILVLADHETGGLALTGGDIKQGKLDTRFVSTDHTAVPVVVFAYGPKAYLFTGVHQNTEIFSLLKQILNL